MEEFLSVDVLMLWVRQGARPFAGLDALPTALQWRGGTLVVFEDLREFDVPSEAWPRVPALARAVARLLRRPGQFALETAVDDVLVLGDYAHNAPIPGLEEALARCL